MKLYAQSISAVLGLTTIFSHESRPNSSSEQALAETKPLGIGSWAEVIEAEVDPGVVTDPVLRDAIKATGLPWRVRDKGTKIEMLLIPPGEFVMGKSEGDDEAKENELPAHQVKLTTAFYLGRYEVTQQQFAGITKATPSEFAKFQAPTLEALMKEGDTKSAAEKKVQSWVAPPPAPDAKEKEWPVETVSWDDSAAFCKKAGLRLPTEAEWEYACRAGTRTLRYGELDEIAWFKKNGRGQTHAVGTKRGNALGLHDMLGGVWEWVNDLYGSKYYATSNAVNPQGPSSGTTRVLRGGSWVSQSLVCRASNRYNRTPANSVNGLGFRVAKTP